MTKLENTLKRLQRSAEALVRREIRFGGLPPLYTNNQNRQAMIHYEVFRHTAYAVLDDGGAELVIEMMTQVAKELRAFDKAAKEKGARPDQDAFRKTWTQKTLFETLGWFEELDADRRDTLMPPRCRRPLPTVANIVNGTELTGTQRY